MANVEVHQVCIQRKTTINIYDTTILWTNVEMYQICIQWKTIINIHYGYISVDQYRDLTDMYSMKDAIRMHYLSANA